MRYEELGPGDALDTLVFERVMGRQGEKARFSTDGPANQAMIDRLRAAGFEYRLVAKGLRPPWVARFGRDGKSWQASAKTQFAANCIAAIKASE